MDPLAAKLILDELQKLCDKFDARFAKQDAEREASRGVPVPIQSATVGVKVVADNWGGLFDSGDEQQFKALIAADNWGGLFEHPAERDLGVSVIDVFDSAQIRHEHVLNSIVPVVPEPAPVLVAASAAPEALLDAGTKLIRCGPIDIEYISAPNTAPFDSAPGASTIECTSTAVPEEYPLQIPEREKGGKELEVVEMDEKVLSGGSKVLKAVVSALDRNSVAQSVFSTPHLPQRALLRRPRYTRLPRVPPLRRPWRLPTRPPRPRRRRPRRAPPRPHRLLRPRHAPPRRRGRPPRLLIRGHRPRLRARRRPRTRPIQQAPRRRLRRRRRLHLQPLPRLRPRLRQWRLPSVRSDLHHRWLVVLGELGRTPVSAFSIESSLNSTNPDASACITLVPIVSVVAYTSVAENAPVENSPAPPPSFLSAELRNERALKVRRATPPPQRRASLRWPPFSRPPRAPPRTLASNTPASAMAIQRTCAPLSRVPVGAEGLCIGHHYLCGLYFHLDRADAIPEVPRRSLADNDPRINDLLDALAHLTSLVVSHAVGTRSGNGTDDGVTLGGYGGSRDDVPELGVAEVALAAAAALRVDAVGAAGGGLLAWLVAAGSTQAKCSTICLADNSSFADISAMWIEEALCRVYLFPAVLVRISEGVVYLSLDFAEQQGTRVLISQAAVDTEGLGTSDRVYDRVALVVTSLDGLRMLIPVDTVAAFANGGDPGFCLSIIDDAGAVSVDTSACLICLGTVGLGAMELVTWRCALVSTRPVMEQPLVAGAMPVHACTASVLDDPTATARLHGAVFELPHLRAELLLLDTGPERTTTTRAATSWALAGQFKGRNIRRLQEYRLFRTHAAPAGVLVSGVAFADLLDTHFVQSSRWSDMAPVRPVLWNFMATDGNPIDQQHGLGASRISSGGECQE